MKYQWELLLPSLKSCVKSKHEKVLSTSAQMFSIWILGSKNNTSFEAKKGNLKRSIYIHSSLIVCTNWGGVNSEHATAGSLNFLWVSWFRLVARYGDVAAQTFGDRVKPVERDGQVEEGNLSRVWVSKLKTSDKALISQRGNTCLNRFRIQTMDFSAKYLKTIRGFFIIF